LKNFDENHLAKILLSRSARTVRAHHLSHKRIKLPDQRASRLIVMLERSLNQRACIRIIHVIESASTPSPMTGMNTLRLQVCHKERRFPNRPWIGNKNVTGEIGGRSLATEAQEARSKTTNIKL